METGVYFLSLSVLTFISFNLANSLRAAINRGDIVRNVAKIFCSLFCIFVAVMFLTIHLVNPIISVTFAYIFHVFIILFQMAMIWFPPPK